MILGPHLGNRSTKVITTTCSNPVLEAGGDSERRHAHGVLGTDGHNQGVQERGGCHRGVVAAAGAQLQAC